MSSKALSPNATPSMASVLHHPRPMHVAPANSADRIESRYAGILSDHWRVLSNLTPEHADARPLVLIATPRPSASANNSIGRHHSHNEREYRELNKQIAILKDESERGVIVVDSHALTTAAEVVKEIQRQSIAPPELTWLGDEAIVLLWALGKTKYALTVTPDEIGYVVRRDRATILRRSNLSLSQFKNLRLK